MTYTDFQRAKPEHEMGIRAPLKNMSKEARKHLAYYQAGRAVAVRLFLPEHRISRITIIRQGTAFGHVSHYPAREAYQGMRTRDQYLNYLRALVAGKAAEIEFCGVQNQTLNVVQRRSYASAVGGDLGEVRRWMNMMASAGMFGPLGATVGMSPEMPPDMAEAMEAMLDKISKETRKALRENAHIVNALVELLLKKEELLADDVKAFFDQYNLPTPEPTLIRDGEEITLLPELVVEGEITGQEGGEVIS
jgi:cell division protease FtsH